MFADILSPVVELAHVRLCFGAGLVIPKPEVCRVRNVFSRDGSAGNYVLILLI